MMSWGIRCACLAALGLVSTAAWAQTKIPSVLIVQAYAPRVNDVDPNLTLDSYIAGMMEEEGRVLPIVWSLSDPVFRGLVEDGEIERFTPLPTEKQIREVAGRLKVDYVLTIAGIKEDGQVKPLAQLYRGTESREIWSFGRVEQDRKYRPVVVIDGKRDEQRTKELIEKYGSGASFSQAMVVTINGFPDWESTSRSVARTWLELLAASAWSKHPPHPRVKDPVEVPGSNTQPQGLIIAAAADDSVLAKADELIAEGRPDMAIMVLRDAIDIAPFEPKRRLKLAQLLLNQGLYEDAAREARRAAKLSPQHVDLWLMSAKAWLLARNPEEAQNDVNEALARNANQAATQDVLGEIYVLTGRFEEAIVAFTKSIETAPKPSAIIGRAIAYAMAGQAEKCTEDLGRLGTTTPASILAAYNMVIPLADQGMDVLGAELRELMPAIRLNPKSPEVIARAARAQARAEGLARLIESFPVPERHKNSHDGRNLAHKLLAQSAQETLDFAKTGDSDLGSEAAISLGEALKLLPNIREMFRIEQREQVPSSKP